MQDVLELLTPAAREALEINAAEAYEALVPERPHAPARAILERVASGAAVARAKNQQMDRAALAGLWLWHDFLDESHTISQSIETPEGSFWHAIMHRREGDFWNSKYWLRRVGRHESFELIAASARAIVSAVERPDTFHKVIEGGWDPMAFVDLCETLHGRPDDPAYATAVSLQKQEWYALFACCALRACD